MESSKYSTIIDGEQYNKLMEQHLYIGEADAVIKALIQREIRVIGNAEIVEIGCGPARVTGFIQEIISNPITGIDIDEDFLLYARNQNQRSKFVQASAITYIHDLPVDIFYSQGVHHHIPKGDETEQYLRNIYAQLREGGCYILGDEFFPKYRSEEERQRRAIVWYGHVIARALKDGYKELAVEEAKTVLDDLREGDSSIQFKTKEEINRTIEMALLLEEARVKRKSRREIITTYLQTIKAEKRSGESDLLPSRGDYKICEAVLREEIKPIGFQIETVARIGPLEDIGAMNIYLLRK